MSVSFFARYKANLCFLSVSLSVCTCLLLIFDPYVFSVLLVPCLTAAVLLLLLLQCESKEEETNRFEGRLQQQ